MVVFLFFAVPSSCNPNPCGTHGTCLLLTSPNGPIAYCNCADGWSGKFCDMNIAGKLNFDHRLIQNDK